MAGRNGGNGGGPAHGAQAPKVVDTADGKVRGEAVDERQAYGTVPAYWSAAIRDAARETPADQRIAVRALRR